jgi:ABC-2 type transport system ATP-binding protein
MPERTILVLTNAIEVEQLTRYFGEHRGIEDLTFNVEEGEIFGFLGPNGAGKTVTIRNLMGFLRPTRGSARILGLDCWSQTRDVKAQVGYMPGDARFYEQMTGQEFLDFFAAFRGGQKHEERTRQLIERLEVDVSRRIKHLSRGNRQKLLIVQALMHDTPVLILDEPSAGLDPLKQVDFLDLLREERSRGKTIFLSSHQLTEVERIADRVGIIRDGVLVAVEDVGSLKAVRERKMEITFGEAVERELFEPIDGVRVLSQAADGHFVELALRGELRPLLALLSSLPVEDIVFGPPELESVFLHYYGERGRLREQELVETVAES